jgi:hypothetical protein
MKKIAITALLLLGIRFHSYGQIDINTERASQQKVELMLVDVIEIAFNSTNSRTGPMVDLDFKTVGDYYNGVESAPQLLKVRSNRGFTVSVKTSSSTMSYTGQAHGRNNVNVADALNIRVPQNNTGGNIAAPFSGNAYKNLSSHDKVLLDACNRGNDQNFSVQYKAAPKVAYAPGAYTVDVVYTASRS